MELRAERVAAGGDAIAHADDGRVVFVEGALPGESVLADVTEERKGFLKAVAVEVLDPSPHRVAPPCPQLARGCGGCGWQHVDLPAQLDLKREIVLDALHRIGKLTDPVVVRGPVLPVGGHRTTIRLAVASGRAGFRRHRSHDVVDVDSCLVAHPLLAELLTTARFGDAAEVTLRCGARTGERLVLASPSAQGVRVAEGVTLVGADELDGGHRAWFHEEVAGRRWRISARSFFQARPDGAEALVDVVARAAEGAPAGRLVDAYGGVGLFAGTIGADRPTTLVEWSSSSTADAAVNVPAVKVLRLDVARWRPSKASLVVADPARDGLGRAAAGALAATGASHLVLVSCDPAALGRDAQLLAGYGFRHDGTTLVDLFPHTPHVEAVTRFIR
jgi:23S rRNA (uracil1939-C5)-methyltransferase